MYSTAPSSVVCFINSLAFITSFVYTSWELNLAGVGQVVMVCKKKGKCP